MLRHHCIRSHRASAPLINLVYQDGYACQSVSRSVFKDTTVSYRHIAPTSKSCPTAKTRIAVDGNGASTSGDVHDGSGCSSGRWSIILDAGASDTGRSIDQRFG